jgi:ABC-type multidrug transport system fused ATPase/permease subunit
VKRDNEQNSPRAKQWNWLFQCLRPVLWLQLSGLACMLAASALSLSDPLILRWLIDNALKQGRAKPALALIALLLASAMFRLILLGYSNLTATRVLQRIVLRLRARLLKQVQSMPAGFFDGRPVGDLVFRLEQDIDQVAQLGTEVAPTVLRMVMITVFVLAAMFYLDWRLALLGALSLPIFLVVRIRFKGALEEASNVSRLAAGDRSSFVTESLTGALQIQLLGAERTVRRKYLALAIAAVRASLAQRRMELAYTLGSLAVISTVTAGVLSAGAFEVVRGTLTVGGFVAFYSYLTWLFEPMGAALEMYARFQRAGASIRRIREIEDEQAPVSSGRTIAAETRFTSVRCEDLTFAYPAGQTALNKVSVELREGEKVALIGRSGSGKSTLAKLLVRCYDPQAGSIRLGGENSRDFHPHDLRRSIALVPQDPVLFRGTLRENLRLGRLFADDDELQLASYVSCFDEVLARLPGGWDHALGPFGGGLSGGEKQRLAVARALLQDRPVLILDEATSALDPIVEAELLSRLKSHAGGKTILLISHRASAAQWAERVLTFERGQVVAPEEIRDLALDYCPANGTPT